jgi:uncharacterized protein (TIGR01319 family)
VKAILLSRGKEVEVTNNVLPSTDEMKVEPVRELIRELFVRRIVDAKGLRETQQFLGVKIVMPTPMAVLAGAELLALGAADGQGLGELLLVDVGGATTDVHSVAKGYPTRPGVIAKGLHPPYCQRTVEGDLGIRYNAVHVVSQIGEEAFLAVGRRMFPSSTLTVSTLNEKLEKVRRDIGFVPLTETDHIFDAILARVAVAEAVSRHVATLKPTYVPEGLVYLQEGKDLSGVDTVIGVGGVFAHGRHARLVLEGAVQTDDTPLLLKPIRPRLLIDRHYLLYAIGLLREVDPEIAFRIGSKYMEVI